VGGPFVGVVAATKADLEATVATEEGEQLASHLGMMYFETSAKTGQNVSEMMQALVERIVT
jgi:translation elongation factor EF-4